MNDLSMKSFSDLVRLANPYAKHQILPAVNVGKCCEAIMITGEQIEEKGIGNYKRQEKIFRIYILRTNFKFLKILLLWFAILSLLRDGPK
jgi:hypothetical protein